MVPVRLNLRIEEEAYDADVLTSAPSCEIGRRERRAGHRDAVRSHGEIFSPYVISLYFQNGRLVRSQ